MVWPCSITADQASLQERVARMKRCPCQERQERKQNKGPPSIRPSQIQLSFLLPLQLSFYPYMSKSMAPATISQSPSVLPVGPSSVDHLEAQLSSPSSHESLQYLPLVRQLSLFLDRSHNTVYSIAPATLESHAEHPILEQEGEAQAKRKWSPSAIFQRMHREHKVKQLDGVPGVRQSILAILKSSRKPYTTLLSPVSLHNYLGVLGRIERSAHLYTAFRACFYCHLVNCDSTHLLVDFPYCQTQ